MTTPTSTTTSSPITSYVLPAHTPALSSTFSLFHVDRARALSEAQIDQLVRTILGWEAVQGNRRQRAELHRDRAIALLMVLTGIAVREVCDLQMDQWVLNPDGSAVLRVGTPQRCVPLPTVAVKSISRWLSLRTLAYCHEDVQFEPQSSVAPLFTTYRLEPTQPHQVQQLLQRLRRKSGIAFTTCDLRHTFIARMLMQGHAPDHIARMVGRPSRSIINLYSYRNALATQAVQQ